MMTIGKDIGRGSGMLSASTVKKRKLRGQKAKLEYHFK